MEGKWFTVKEAASYMGLSSRTLQEDINQEKPIKSFFRHNGHKHVTKAIYLDGFMNGENAPF